jgi:hypothetical protein
MDGEMEEVGRKREEKVWQREGKGTGKWRKKEGNANKKKGEKERKGIGKWRKREGNAKKNYGKGKGVTKESERKEVIQGVGRGGKGCDPKGE